MLHLNDFCSVQKLIYPENKTIQSYFSKLIYEKL